MDVVDTERVTTALAAAKAICIGLYAEGPWEIMSEI